MAVGNFLIDENRRTPITPFDTVTFYYAVNLKSIIRFYSTYMYGQVNV